MKKIKCECCNGHYVLRESKYGLFGGCSNYPRCKSTKKIGNLVLNFLKTNGLGIYRWNKTCWKCGKDTPIYSYYLNYDLMDIDEEFGNLSGMGGIGEINIFDDILMNKYPSVKEIYSKTVGGVYIANSCIHCNALQGKNYVVDDPHEIFNDLFIDHTMDKFLIERIFEFGDEERLKNRLQCYFDNMFEYED